MPDLKPSPPKVLARQEVWADLKRVVVLNGWRLQRRWRRGFNWLGYECDNHRTLDPRRIYDVHVGFLVLNLTLRERKFT